VAYSRHDEAVHYSDAVEPKLKRGYRRVAFGERRIECLTSSA
jgi:hypothetical protein